MLVSAQVTFGPHDPSFTLENTGGGGEFGYIFMDLENGVDGGGGQSSSGAFGFKTGMTVFGPGEDIPFGYSITQIDVSIASGSNPSLDDITVYLETAGGSVELTADPFVLSSGNTTYMKSYATSLLSVDGNDQLYFALISRGTDSVLIRDVSLTIHASAVPEPTTAALGLGVTGLLWVGWRRRGRR